MMDNNINTTATWNTTENINEEMVHECELFPDQPSRCDILVICKRVSCTISIIGVLLVLTIIIIFKKYREFTQRLIANLCLASLLLSISTVMSDFSSSSRGFCVFQGVAITYLVWAVLLGSMNILASLYVGVMLQRDLRKFEKHLMAVCWLLPIFFAVIPFADDVYGPAGVWCWMKNKWGWRFGVWYIWKTISVIVFFIAIIQIWYKLLRKPEVTAAQRREIREDIKTLRIYPLTYFVLSLFSTINRTVNAVDDIHGQTGYNFSLLLLHVITSPLLGTCVALNFALDSRTRRMLRQKGVVTEIKKKWRRSGKVKEYVSHERTDDATATSIETDSGVKEDDSRGRTDEATVTSTETDSRNRTIDTTKVTFIEAESGAKGCDSRNRTNDATATSKETDSGVKEDDVRERTDTTIALSLETDSDVREYYTPDIADGATVTSIETDSIAKEYNSREYDSHDRPVDVTVASLERESSEEEYNSRDKTDGDTSTSIEKDSSVKEYYSPDIADGATVTSIETDSIAKECDPRDITDDVIVTPLETELSDIAL